MSKSLSYLPIKQDQKSIDAIDVLGKVDLLLNVNKFFLSFSVLHFDQKSIDVTGVSS